MGEGGPLEGRVAGTPSALMALILAPSLAGVLVMGAPGALVGPVAAGFGLKRVKGHLWEIALAGSVASAFAAGLDWVQAGRAMPLSPLTVTGYIGMLVLGALTSVLAALAIAPARSLLFERPRRRVRTRPPGPDAGPGPQDADPASRA